MALAPAQPATLTYWTVALTTPHTAYYSTQAGALTCDQAIAAAMVGLEHLRMVNVVATWHEIQLPLV